MEEGLVDSGVRFVVVSPAASRVSSLPIAVSIKVDFLPEGAVADAVRADPKAYRFCYGISMAPTIMCIDLAGALLSSSSTSLASIEAAHLPNGKEGLVFQVWLEEYGGGRLESTVKSVEFGVRFGVDASRARRERWRSEMALLLVEKKPFFVEIGTSYFETLAEERFSDRRWSGVSVEPVAEHAARVPTRDGLVKLVAAVCDEGATTNLYVLEPSGLARSGLPDFFAGMSSMDPRHIWRSPALRARLSHAEFSSLVRKRPVPCVSYPQVLEGRGSGVFAHLKVDAEGQDVRIVRASIKHARRTGVWPLRVDFEASHAHDRSVENRTPKRFGLRFTTEVLHVFDRTEDVDDAPAFLSAGQKLRLHFDFAQGNWRLMDGEVLVAWTLTEDSYAEPWEASARWEHQQEAVFVFLEEEEEEEDFEDESPEAILGELEDEGYACGCLGIDCSCFTSQRKLQLKLHPRASSCESVVVTAYVPVNGAKQPREVYEKDAASVLTEHLLNVPGRCAVFFGTSSTIAKVRSRVIIDDERIVYADVNDQFNMPNAAHATSLPHNLTLKNGIPLDHGTAQNLSMIWFHKLEFCAKAVQLLLLLPEGVVIWHDASSPSLLSPPSFDLRPIEAGEILTAIYPPNRSDASLSFQGRAPCVAKVIAKVLVMRAADARDHAKTFSNVLTSLVKKNIFLDEEIVLTYAAAASSEDWYHQGPRLNLTDICDRPNVNCVTSPDYAG